MQGNRCLKDKSLINNALLEQLYNNTALWDTAYSSWDYNVNSLTGIDSIMWMIDLLQLVLW